MSKESDYLELTKAEETEFYNLPKNNFIDCYAVAEQIVNQACLSHQSYWDVLDICKKHIAGEKPVSHTELEKMGMGWAWNFNYGKASAKLEKGTAESVARVFNALALSYVTFRSFEKGDKKTVLKFLESEEARGIVAANIGYALFHTISRENRLSSWLNQVEYASYGMGYCALVFEEYDWMPKAFDPTNIAFKPHTKPDNIECWVTFELVDALCLYDRWTTAKNKKTQGKEDLNGWNVDALEKLLHAAFRGSVNDGKGGTRIPANWDEVLPEFRKSPSNTIMQTDSVNLSKIYYRELDGTLSLVIIPWNNRWDSQNTAKDPQGAPTVNALLYSKNLGKYVQRNHVNLVRDSGFSPSDGTIQSMRGIMKYAVEDSIRYNRLRNGIGNKMTFVGAPMFEQSNSQSGKKFKLTVSQGFVLLPDSHNIIEKQPNFDIASHINALNFEEGQYVRDTQQFDASVQGRLTSRPSKGEVQTVAAEVAATSTAKDNVKFRDYSTVFLTVLERFPDIKATANDPGYEGRKRFYAVLKKNLGDIIKDDDDIDKILEAIDSYSLEPITSNVETIMIAIQMAETPFARNRLKRMLLVAKNVPIEEVNIAVPLISDKFQDLGDARVAAFENDMFFTTNEVIIAGTDDHVIHLDSHLAKNDRIIQGAKEGRIDPASAFKYLENNLIHATKHCEMLGEDPSFSKKAADYMFTIKEQLKEKDQIKAAAQQILADQQAAAGQVKLDPETEADIYNERRKAETDIARKDALAASRTDQSYKRLDAQHELEREKIQLNAQNKQYESQLKAATQP